MRGGGSGILIENKCTITFDRLNRVIFTFDSPAASDITIVYVSVNGKTEAIIPKGTTTVRGEIFGGIYDLIEQIIPSEDNIYIFIRGNKIIYKTRKGVLNRAPFYFILLTIIIINWSIIFT